MLLSTFWDNSLDFSVEILSWFLSQFDVETTTPINLLPVQAIALRQDITGMDITMTLPHLIAYIKTDLLCITSFLSFYVWLYKLCFI